MKVISVVNQKGGVGKTVTTVNLAVGLANKGKKVLAIDLDPQGSLSISLGLHEPDELNDTISNIIWYVKDNIDFDVNYAIRKHKENIDFIPANIQLATLEMQLVNSICRESILSKYIELIKDKYDIVIIDCSPSLGMLTINSLACSNEVIIPVQSQYLSVKGMQQLFSTIIEIKTQINKNLKICGILITMVDYRTNSSKDIINFINSKYSREINVFTTLIPTSVKASDMSIEGESIYKYDPHGKVAIAYKELVNEVFEILERSSI